MVAPIVIAGFQFLALALVFPQLPFQAMALGADPITVTMLLATDTMAAVFLAPLFGRLSDRFGRKHVILAGLAAAPVGYILLASASSLEVMFLSRLLSGAGLATVSVTQAYIADRTQSKSRLAGLAGLNGAYGLAFVAGPLTASIFFIGDQAAYHATAGVSLACTAVSLVLAGLCLATNAPADRAGASVTIDYAGADDVAARDRRISILLAASGAVIFAYSAMSATVGVWSKSVLAWGPKELSLAFAVAGGASVLAQMALASRLRKAVDEMTLVLFAGLAMGGGLTMLAWMPHPLGTMAIMAVIGFSTAIAFTCVQFLILSHAPVSSVGKVAGIGQSVVGLARVLGPALGGVCLTYLGLSSPYLLGALLAVGVAAAMQRLRHSRQLRFSTL